MIEEGNLLPRLPLFHLPLLRRSCRPCQPGAGGCGRTGEAETGRGTGCKQAPIVCIFEAVLLTEATCSRAGGDGVTGARGEGVTGADGINFTGAGGIDFTGAGGKSVTGGSGNGVTGGGGNGVTGGGGVSGQRVVLATLYHA